MEDEFGNSREVSILGLSFFVLGIGLGPMFLGPLSEFYGRRLIYVVSWTLYVIFIIPQAVAQNIETVIVSRFLDGFAGSAFLAVSGGTVGDLFTANELQAPMLMFSLAPFVGPSIGPLIGGFINYNTDWRWTHWTLLIWAFVLLLGIVFLVPETYRESKLASRANLSHLTSTKIRSCSRTKQNRCERKLEMEDGKPLQKRFRNQPPAR
jgi:multidrug resistance protein